MKKPILCTGGALRVCCVMVTDEAVGAWCVSDDLAQLLVMVHVTWAATGATSRANGGAPGGGERQLFDASTSDERTFSTCDERAAARAARWATPQHVNEPRVVVHGVPESVPCRGGRLHGAVQTQQLVVFDAASDHYSRFSTSDLSGMTGKLGLT